MNEPELNQMEQELRKLTPASPPECLVTRLTSLRPEPTSSRPQGERPTPDTQPTRRSWWPSILSLRPSSRTWWFAPAFGLALLTAGLFLVLGPGTRREAEAPQLATSIDRGSKAPPEALEIDRELVASYETVAEVADRGPVRFRLDRWEDRITFRDPVRGISIERREPRVEIVPVSYESY